MLFKNDAEKEFNIESITSAQMEAVLNRCAMIYGGHPPWMDYEDGIRTINFARSVCAETARLTTLAVSINVDGSGMGDYIQSVIDKTYYNLRVWVQRGFANGTIVLKPNGGGIDAFTPDEFIVTSVDDNGKINGIVFKDSYQENDRSYTRLEYHRFEADNVYAISNRAYVSDNPDSLGHKIDMAKTKWSELLSDAYITKANDEKLDAPLFGVFTTPDANDLDPNSPLGQPLFAPAIEELKDLDIAYSRNAGEIKESQKIVLLDDRLMTAPGKKIRGKKPDVELPHFVKNVMGSEPKDFYQEINPELRTDIRKIGINQQLSFVAYKCGYSNGYFSFDEKTGVVTATQIEADQQRTIQFIKDCRDKLQCCMDGVIYAIQIMAELYGLAPSGPYEVEYGFGDIIYSYEEDKANWWKYVVQGKIPAWKYFVKFENMTEDEAKALTAEAQPREPMLFAREE